MSVTTLEMLKQVKESLYKEVELPPFPNGMPLVVEVKPIDLVKLAAGGKLPNQLLKAAMEVFETKGNTKEVEDMILKDDKKLIEVMEFVDVIAEAILVRPTLKDFKKVGVEMTWEQKLALLSYTMGGSEMLTTFREESERLKSN